MVSIEGLSKGALWQGLGLTLLALPSWADTALDEPLSLSNRAPLVQIFALPGARSGAVLGAGESAWRIGYDVANNFASARSTDESIHLDGETQRLDLGVSAGIGERWELGLEVPYLRHAGGDLDSLIEGWHRFWGLPDGGRPEVPRNQLAYQYSRFGQRLVDLQKPTEGVGDIQFKAAYSLISNEQREIALAGNLSAPTGDANKLTGSGATQLSVTLAASENHLFDSDDFSATANLGVLRIQDGDIQGLAYKDSVWFGSAELSFAPAQDWRLKLQLDAHTAFYHSALRELGSDSVQLLLGGSVRVSQHWLLDAAIAEDLAVDTAPDVVFQLALHSRY